MGEKDLEGEREGEEGREREREGGRHMWTVVVDVGVCMKYIHALLIFVSCINLDWFLKGHSKNANNFYPPDVLVCQIAKISSRN